MSNGKFYHVYLTPKPGVEIETIKKQFNLALDWFTYDRNNWVVYSNAPIQKLMTRFKPLVEPEGRLFICELNSANRNGWMNKDFWEWLKKKRDK